MEILGAGTFRAALACLEYPRRASAAKPGGEDSRAPSGAFQPLTGKIQYCLPASRYPAQTLKNLNISIEYEFFVDQTNGCAKEILPEFIKM